MELLVLPSTGIVVSVLYLAGFKALNSQYFEGYQVFILWGNQYSVYFDPLCREIIQSQVRLPTVVHVTNISFCITLLRNVTFSKKPEEKVMDKLHEHGVGVRSLDDPFFNAGNEICRMYKKKGIIDEDDEKLCHKIYSTFKCHIPSCSQDFDSLLDFENHYNSCHRFSCHECKKQLPSPHLLDLHLSETHDSFFKAQAERKPMYKCFVEACNIVKIGPAERRTHCIEEHNFPHDFRFDPVNSCRGKSKKNKTKKNAMELDEEKSPELKKPTNRKKGPFTFGHRVNAKTFDSKRVGQNNVNTKIEMQDLMESLPS